MGTLDYNVQHRNKVVHGSANVQCTGNRELSRGCIVDTALESESDSEAQLEFQIRVLLSYGKFFILTLNITVNCDLDPLKRKFLIKGNVLAEKSIYR